MPVPVLLPAPFLLLPPPPTVAMSPSGPTFGGGGAPRPWGAWGVWGAPLRDTRRGDTRLGEPWRGRPWRGYWGSVSGEGTGQGGPCGTHGPEPHGRAGQSPRKGLGDGGLCVTAVSPAGGTCPAQPPHRQGSPGPGGAATGDPRDGTAGPRARKVPGVPRRSLPPAGSLGLPHRCLRSRVRVALARARWHRGAPPPPSRGGTLRVGMGPGWGHRLGSGDNLPALGTWQPRPGQGQAAATMPLQPRRVTRRGQGVTGWGQGGDQAGTEGDQTGTGGGQAGTVAGPEQVARPERLAAVPSPRRAQAAGLNRKGNFN